MESKPEKKSRILKGTKKHGNPSHEEKHAFTPLDILETIGCVVFEEAGVALHEAEFHVSGFIFNFFGAWCGLLVLRHRLHHSKFNKSASSLYWLLLIVSFLFFSFLSWSVFSKNPEQSIKSNDGTDALRHAPEKNPAAVSTNEYWFAASTQMNGATFKKRWN